MLTKHKNSTINQNQIVLTQLTCSIETDKQTEKLDTNKKPHKHITRDNIISKSEREHVYTDVETIEQQTPEKTIKKRTIKKKTGKRQEVTEIVTIHEENKEPQTTVTVVESEIPVEELEAFEPQKIVDQKTKKITEETPSDVKITEILTEEQTPDKTIKKRTIKKKTGKRQEVTEIVTVHEENKEPQTTVTVVESEIPVEELEAFEPQKIVDQKTKRITEETPSDVKITEILTEEQTPDKTIKKRTIKKKTGKRQEVTEIVTVHEENKEPQTTVTVVESEIPVEELEAFEPQKIVDQKTKKIIEETPSDVKITEILTEEQTPDKTIKKRTIKKKTGKRQEVTEIVTIHEENKEPQTTVTVVESEIPVEELEAFEPQKIVDQKTKKIIEETPSDVKITEILTEEQTPDKTIKKRTIKKKTGKRQEVTEIVTVHEKNKEPQTTVTVVESEIPVEELEAFEPQKIVDQKTKKITEETPSDVKITEILTEEQTPDKTIKKRTIKKKTGKRQEVTEIVTIHEENKEPQTTVTVVESEIPVEELEAFEPQKIVDQKTKKITEETPSDVKITEILTEEQTPDKTIKKRTIKKKTGKRQEVTEIVTIHEENKGPQTTVTVVESEIPVEELEAFEPQKIVDQKTKKITEETPSDVKITEILTEEQTPDKTIKKRTIKKKTGKRQEVTEIVTIHEENKEPQTTVTVVESEIPVEELEAFEPQKIVDQKTKKITEETPSDVKITEILTEEQTPDKTIKKRTIKKKTGKRQEVTEIVTIHEENKEPQTTVTVVESEIPVEELEAFEPQKIVDQKTKKITEETPSDVKITEILTEEQTPDKTIKKRTIKKKTGKRQEVTEIVTIHEENKEPQTTVTVVESEIPVEELEAFEPQKIVDQKTKKITEETPSDVKITEILTEEQTPDKTIKKRTIKKKTGKRQEVTEIVTVHEENKEPQTTVTVVESEIPVEELEAFEPQKIVDQKTKKITEETPSDVKITEILTEEQTPDKTIKKRTIKKKTGKRQEVTEIVTVHEENKEPQTTVTVVESEIPVEELEAFEPQKIVNQKTKRITEETPSDVKITEILTEEQTPDKTIKKRTIKKKTGKRQEVTEIVTIHEENKEPQTTVTVVESEIPVEELEAFEPQKIVDQKTKKITEETPLDVKITEILTEEQTPDKTIKKRTIKKKTGKRQEVTEIVTVHEENKEPQTTVTVVESEIPVEELEAFEPQKIVDQKTKKITEETPSDVKITEILTEEQTPDKTIKKRTIKKKTGKRQEVTEIVTIHEENKEPQTTVTVVESEIPVEELEAFEPQKIVDQKTKKITEETPSDVKITEILTEEQTPDKTIKKRTIKKKTGKRQEVTEIVTVHEENKEPQTTVTVVESEIPVEELEAFEPQKIVDQKTKRITEETPSDVKITEILTEEQTPDKTIKKRTIKKKTGKRQEVTEIVTIHEENKEPQTTVTVVESEIPVEELEAFEPQKIVDQKTKKITEETPSDVKITEILTEEQTPDKTIKKRTIKKKTGKRQEVTEIVTIHEENKEPQTTVTVVESEIPVEELEAFEPQKIVDQKTKKITEETPSDVKITEILTEEQTPDKTIKKRTIKKKTGKRQEVTEIVTIHEENKEPQTTVTVVESEIPVEELEAFEPQKIVDQKTKKITEETPSDVKITEILTEEQTPDKTIKKRTIKKKTGKRQEVTEIVTVHEENKEPQTTVTVVESEIPVEELEAFEPQKIVDQKTKRITEETPSDVKITEILTEEQTPDKTIKKRTIKKKTGKRQEVTEIVTIHEENKEPQTTVTVVESEIPVEELEAFEPQKIVDQKTKKITEETPSDVKITEILTEEQTPDKTIKKRTIKKKTGKRQEVTEIVTIHEENKEPQTTVTVVESEIPVEELEAFEPQKIVDQKTKKITEETPSDVKITEILTEEQTPDKTIKKRTIKKKTGKRQEVTEIVTIHEENKEPQTTVTVVESEIPVEELEAFEPQKIVDQKTKKITEETPSDVKITEILTEEQTPDKTIKKRTIKKKTGKRQEVTEIVTIHEENKEPQTTVTVVESEIPVEELEAFEPQKIVDQKTKKITEETPSDVKITEILTEEQTPDKTIKKRTIKKKTGKRQEVTEIVTIHEENKEPQTTVTVVESEIPVEELEAFEPQKIVDQKTKRITEETPSDVKITEILTEEQTPDKTIKKRTIKKKTGKRQEVTEIVTIHEENKEPQTTVTTFEYEIPELFNIIPDKDITQTKQDTITLDKKETFEFSGKFHTQLKVILFEIILIILLYNF